MLLALNCDPAEDNLYRDFMQNVQSTMINATLVDCGENKILLASTFGYLAWTSELGDNGSLPLIWGYVDEDLYNVRPGTVFEQGLEKLGLQGVDDKLHLFILTFPHMLEQGNRTEEELIATTQMQYFCVVRCTMHPIRLISLDNGQQNIGLSPLQHLNKVGYLNRVVATYTNFRDLSEIQNKTVLETFPYQYVMAQFGSLLVGNINKESYVVQSPATLHINRRSLLNASSSSFRINHRCRDNWIIQHERTKHTQCGP